MLVLTRKLGEKILIGDDITITVVNIGKSRVKLGIEAPAGHRILRSELVVERRAATETPMRATRGRLAVDGRSRTVVARTAEAVAPKSVGDPSERVGRASLVRAVVDRCSDGHAVGLGRRDRSAG